MDAVVDGSGPKIHVKIATSASVCLCVFLPANVSQKPDVQSSTNFRCMLPVADSGVITVGDRAFPVAGPAVWNSLPDNVISAQRLKTAPFPASFPDVIIDHP